MKTKIKLIWAPYRRHTRSSVRLRVPERPGVYKLARLRQDGKLVVFYVGQAKGLRGRLLEHLSRSEPNRCIRGWIATGRTYFSYAEVPRQRDRDGAERHLYITYRPACNDPRRIPAGPDIGVNPR